MNDELFFNAEISKYNHISIKFIFRTKQLILKCETKKAAETNVPATFIFY